MAEVTNMDDSMTPESSPIPKLIPIMINPYKTPTALITRSCCPSLNFLKQGTRLKKSSQVTVAKEFRLETFKLK